MSAAAPNPLPPWRKFSDLLSADERSALLGWALGNRDRFEAAGIAGRGADPSLRIADKLRDLGPMHAPIEARLRAMLPDILAAAGSRPFEVDHIELELVAHRDGAFFARHSDMPLGPGRRPLGGDDSGRHERLVSGVYYFHREPKAFSGGALRLYRFGANAEPGSYVDVEPEQNSLVVFPSWASHEVMKVRVPSNAFEDSRFAVNAWFCRATA